MRSFALLVICLSWFSAPPVLAEIRGLYGSDCLNVAGLSAYKDLAFEQEQLTQVQTIFSDDACENAAYNFKIKGPYQLDMSRGALDYEIELVELTPLTEEIAEAFRDHHLCGLDDWELGVAKDVAGQDCGEQVLPPKQVKVYDRLMEDAEGIRLGEAHDEFNGSSPELRPLSFDTVIFHPK